MWGIANFCGRILRLVMKDYDVRLRATGKRNC